MFVTPNNEILLGVMMLYIYVRNFSVYSHMLISLFLFKSWLYTTFIVYDIIDFNF